MFQIQGVPQSPSLSPYVYQHLDLFELPVDFPLVMPFFFLFALLLVNERGTVTYLPLLSPHLVRSQADTQTGKHANMQTCTHSWYKIRPLTLLLSLLVLG